MFVAFSEEFAQGSLAALRSRHTRKNINKSDNCAENRCREPIQIVFHIRQPTPPDKSIRLFFSCANYSAI
jgi:hypothetical protein